MTNQTKKSVKEIFAQNVKNEMDDKGISKSELAEQTGIFDSAIDRILKGQSLTSGIIKKISEALDVDYWVLFLDEEENIK